MAIKTIVTRGYGNGTFDGSIAELVTRGYTIGEAVAAPLVYASPRNTTAVRFRDKRVAVKYREKRRTAA